MLLVKRLPAALALSLLCATPASAATLGPDEGPSALGTLPLELGKGVGERMRGSLESGLSDGLGRGSASVSPIEGADKKCDRDCQEAVGAKQGLSHVVSGRITKEGPDFAIVLSAHEVGTEGEPIIVEDSCEICGESELTERVADLSATLLTRMEETSAREATMEVSGSPMGATVYVDGESVGRAPVELTMEPGTHEIEIRKDGFETEQHTWTATEGVADKISFDLQRSQKRRGKHHIIRPVGYALAGLGVGMITTGAVLMTIDGNEHKNTCTDDLMDVDGDCPFRYATKGAGIGFLVGGVVAAGASAGLLTWSFKTGGKTEAEATLNVGPRSVGATLRF